MEEKIDHKGITRIVEEISRLIELILNLRSHLKRLEELKKRCSEKGDEGGLAMLEAAIELEQKELEAAERKFNWEKLKLEALQNEGKAKKLTDWKKEIEHIKLHVPIEEVIGQYVELKRSGERYLGRCPFHQDRRPSLVVYPETGSFYCYGCQKGGDVFTFLMEIEHLSFKEAVKVLSQRVWR